MAGWALEILQIPPMHQTADRKTMPSSYRVSRETLAHMLMLLSFERWQCESYVEFTLMDEAANDACKPPSLPQAPVHTEKFKNKWLRIVDLALLSAGHNDRMIPLSHEAIDQRLIPVDQKALAYIFKCARYESWSEPGWEQTPSIAAMKKVVETA